MFKRKSAPLRCILFFSPSSPCHRFSQCSLSDLQVSQRCLHFFAPQPNNLIVRIMSNYDKTILRVNIIFLPLAPSVLWLRLPVPDTMVPQPSLFSQSAALQSLFPMKSTFCTGGLLQRHIFLFRCFLLQPSPPLKLLTTTWVGAMNMTGI